MFYSIPSLIKHNIDIIAIAAAKLDSSFPESQFLPTDLMSAVEKGAYLCMPTRIFHQNVFEVSIFQMIYKSFPLK